MQDKGSSLKNDDSISSRKSTSQGFDKGNEADQPIPFGGLALIVLGMLIAAPAGFCTFLIVPRAFTSEAHFPASEYALFIMPFVGGRGFIWARARALRVGYDGWTATLIAMCALFTLLGLGSCSGPFYN